MLYHFCPWNLVIFIDNYYARKNSFGGFRNLMKTVFLLFQSRLFVHQPQIEVRYYRINCEIKMLKEYFVQHKRRLVVTRDNPS